MKVPYTALLLLGGLALPSAAAAQEEPTGIIFGAYYRCDQSQEARADTLYQEIAAPAWQAKIDAGLITTAGWARHWAGGEWRRLGYVIGTDMDAVSQARQEYIEEVSSQHPKMVAEFNRICPSHDDYIWTVTASSQAPAEVGSERPSAGLTSYQVCDHREAEADEIVQTAFAPIMNRHVEEGHINSWSWLSHFVGGEYRRALVLDATDYDAILDYWDMLFPALEAEHPELLRAFAAICHSHTDYIWDLSANQ